jgi:putative hydrolase of the HAD superfamily
VIRAVLFDLDGTLYDRDVVMAAVAREQFDLFEDQLNGLDRDTFVQRLLALDDHGYANRGQLYEAAAAALGLRGGIAAELAKQFWDCYARACALPDDTSVTLQALRQRGTRLGVITNGPTAWQSRKLDTLGLAGFFDLVVISESEGLTKPDPRIFARAVERIGVAAGEAMFVGDHPEIDVAGARAAGLIPVWKRVPYWAMPFDDVLIVDRLSEILPRCTRSAGL